ncbi:unnamed protein product [Porites lobata]|uniref:Uncharacterized protein n=1 Tax=Porites lobata TaxID=104759 RepID=A0ABN8R5P0_9CNID|nr:unnamed protein product [Porites lobata]
MTKLSKVKVGGKHYNIEYFLGADWKFLACVCGLGAANQDHARICDQNIEKLQQLWSEFMEII